MKLMQKRPRTIKLGIGNIASVFVLILYSMTTIISKDINSGSFRDVYFTLLLLLGTLLLRSSKIKLDGKYLLLWISAFLSTLFSPYIGFESTILAYFLFCITTILLKNMRFNRRNLQLFIKLFILIATFFALVIIGGWILNVPFEKGRYSLNLIGINKNPNYVNDILLLAIAFCVFRLMQNDGSRIRTIVYIVLLSVGCFLTATRAALLCIVLMVAFTTVYSLVVRRKIGYLITIALILIIGTYVFLNVLPSSVTWRLTGKKVLSDDLRLTMWGTSISELLRYPVLGLGVNGTTVFNSTLGYRVNNIHNTLLQFLCDQGILGLAIFCAIMGSILWRTRKGEKFYIILICIAMYFPIMFQNGVTTFTFWWPFAILETFSLVSSKEGLKEHGT